MKSRAEHEGKWLLVHVFVATQLTDYDINRDVWDTAMVQEILDQGYVLWQVRRESHDGEMYTVSYPSRSQPQIDILDPATGARLQCIHGKSEVNLISRARAAGWGESGVLTPAVKDFLLANHPGGVGAVVPNAGVLPSPPKRQEQKWVDEWVLRPLQEQLVGGGPALADGPR